MVTRFGIGMKDKEWYDYRYTVHKAFGQACMLNQTNQNFDWLICLDGSPPEDFLQKLQDDFKDSKNVHLLRIEKGEYWVDNYRSFINDNLLAEGTEKLVLIRKDDDDALNIDFIQNIYGFLENNEVKLHFIEDEGPTAKRIQPMIGCTSWTRRILEFFKDSPDIIKYLFFAKADNDVNIYYKNNFVTCVGRISKYGKVDFQLQEMNRIINTMKDSAFTPYACINSNSHGLIFNKDGQGNLHRTVVECSSFGLYSILPIKNKKMSQFRDCVYESSVGHSAHHAIRGTVYNNVETDSQFLAVRTEVNDSYGSALGLISSTSLDLDTNWKRTFGINDEDLHLYKALRTNYKIIRKAVERNIENLRFSQREEEPKKQDPLCETTGGADAGAA